MLWKVNDVSTELANSRMTSDELPVMDDMTEAKLWKNPCGMAFRLNYLALRYNTACYDWVQRTHGLSRIEYVVIYSLTLCPGGQARDIASYITPPLAWRWWVVAVGFRNK